MTNLWSANHPARFWIPRPEIPEEQWQAAIQRAAPVLGLSPQPEGVDALLDQVLGEGQFGPGHWQLGLARPTIPPRLHAGF